MAESQFQLVLEKESADPESLFLYARHLLMLGRPDGAVDVIQNVVEIDPLSSTYQGFYAYTLFCARRIEHSLMVARHAITLESDAMCPLICLCVVAAYSNHHAEALEVGMRLMSINGKIPIIMATYAYACAMAGQYETARQLLDEIPKTHNLQGKSLIALVPAAMGDIETTSKWLAQALTERCSWLPLIRNDPRLDSVRTHPQIRQVLRALEHG